MSLKPCILIAIGMHFAALPASAQMVEVQDAPVQDAPASKAPATGKKKAGSYFQTRQQAKAGETARAPAAEVAAGSHVMMIHAGSFFSDQGYNWGRGKQDDIGKFNAGVTYRFGEWVNSMDFSMRFEYTTYSLDEGAARKLSFIPVLTFPDAASGFPLYFGAGIGPGFFIKQLPKESAVALDYQLFAGARFLNLIDQVGFMVETGLKNHLQLFSDGQFNGVYVNVGAVFTF